MLFTQFLRPTVIPFISYCPISRYVPKPNIEFDGPMLSSMVGNFAAFIIIAFYIYRVNFIRFSITKLKKSFNHNNESFMSL